MKNIIIVVVVVVVVVVRRRRRRRQQQQQKQQESIQLVHIPPLHNYHFNLLVFEVLPNNAWHSAVRCVCTLHICDDFDDVVYNTLGIDVWRDALTVRRRVDPKSMKT